MVMAPGAVAVLSAWGVAAGLAVAPHAAARSAQLDWGAGGSAIRLSEDGWQGPAFREQFLRRELLQEVTEEVCFLPLFPGAVLPLLWALIGS